MVKLTQNKLKELLDYNPEAGIFTWKISAGNIKAGWLKRENKWCDDNSPAFQYVKKNILKKGDIMDTDCRDLLGCIKLFAPNFHKFLLEHFVYFASLNLDWSDKKILAIIDELVTDNKITVENNIININLRS